MIFAVAVLVADDVRNALRNLSTPAEFNCFVVDICLHEAGDGRDFLTLCTGSFNQPLHQYLLLRLQTESVLDGAQIVGHFLLPTSARVGQPDGWKEINRALPRFPSVNHRVNLSPAKTILKRFRLDLWRTGEPNFVRLGPHEKDAFQYRYSSGEAVFDKNK